MLDICPSDHIPLTLLKIDAAQLGLNHAAVAHDSDEDVQVLGRMGDAGCDVELMRKLGTEIHDGRIVLAKIVHFVWRQLAADVLVGKDVWECAADGPVHVAKPFYAVGMVGEETALVAGDGRLIKQEGGRGVVEGYEEERLGGLFEIALLPDDGTDERVVVFEEGVGRGGPAGFEEELGRELAELSGVGHRRRSSSRRWVITDHRSTIDHVVCETTQPIYGGRDSDHDAQLWHCNKDQDGEIPPVHSVLWSHLNNGPMLGQWNICAS